MIAQPRALAAALAALVLVSGSGTTWADLDDLHTSKLSREPGAVYVEDLFDRPLRLRVKKPAPIYYQLNAQRLAGTLVSDQAVQVVALSDKKAFRVRGRATHGGVSGWVGRDFFEEPEPGFFDGLEKLYERQRLVEDLVARKEVALGMTPEEVIAAIGKPDERSSRVDGQGSEQSFSYITYDRVPQIVPRQDAYGRVFNTTVYIKVETGRRSVHFTDGVVSALELNEQRVQPRGLTIVPPPVVVF
ncbi:hypothetical protein BH23VER1_BH23VER1_20150 [soil metagenome]